MNAGKWANYALPQDESSVGLIMGPDIDGAWLTVVEADGNRLGFAYGPRCTDCLELVTVPEQAAQINASIDKRLYHKRGFGCREVQR